MIDRSFFRRLACGLTTGLTLTVAGLSAPIAIGSFSPAQAQVSAEFQEALTPYGSWRRHARWGEVWVPSERPRRWRPYEAGHWVYTDEWGWFWDTDDSEADWGWITYHYGRWMHDASGWFWIPGDEWAPAWVDWRYSDDYVGWAPLPPDDVDVAYESEPTVWVFVAPRYLTEPRWRTYIAPPQQRVTIFRSSRIVNRTVVFQERGRAAVNPGISPAFIASVTHRPVQSYRVNPHVLANTRGVAGGVIVRPQDLRGKSPRGGRGARGTTVTRVSVQKTDVVIKPEAKPPQAPQALGKGERGRLGNRPPRAAQGAVPANGQPPAGGRRDQRPGQPAPNGQQRPNVAPPAATPVKPAPGAPAGTVQPGQATPSAPAAAPAKPALPATPPHEERRGSPAGAAPAQRGERREERAAPPTLAPPKPSSAAPAPARSAPAVPQREERRAPPPVVAPARPAEPQIRRPATPAPSRSVAPPPAARPQPPAPPRPAAPPPAAARPAAPQRIAPPQPRPPAAKPPQARRPPAAKPAAPPQGQKPEEK